MKKAIFLLTIIFFVVGCNNGTDKKAQLAKLKTQRDKLTEQIQKLEKELLATNDSTAKTKTVAVAPLELSEYRHYIEIQGKVDGDDNIALSIKSPGFVTAINVVQGQPVRKGELLATLDDQVLQQTLKELEASLDYATDLYNRQKNLWDQQIGSEVQYLTAKNNKESLENKITTLKDQINLLKITSPIDGSVEEMTIKVGQYVSPGTSIFRVVNFSHIKVSGEVAEAYAPKVHRGDSVIIFFPDFNKEVHTTLNFSSKFINPVNRTFQIECRFDPRDFECRANMISVIRIMDYKADNAMVLPMNLVQRSINETFVYVAREEGNKKFARKQSVILGSTYNGRVEILSGLNKGDKIITVGYQDLNEGQQISY